MSSTEVAAHLGVSRQAAHRRLRKLLATGAIEKQGAARATRYRLSESPLWEQTYRRPGLDESLVFHQIRDGVAAVHDGDREVVDLVNYVVTELVNNAIDHSSSDLVHVAVHQVGSRLTIAVRDDGVGAFAHVQSGLGLPDELAALQQISKGKTTTDPDRHSGQGLFFVSKAVDQFRLESGGYAWVIDNDRDDWTVETIDPPRRGTSVRVELDVEHIRDLKAIFDRYTEDFEFSKTRIVVKLFAHGVSFISRSEAKRLLFGLDKFEKVVLDFRGVDRVGQGFADEVFRVWARDHPRVSLTPIEMSEPVAFMVERAR